MNAILGSIAKKIAYLCAGLIITAAILVSTARLLTPALDDHKADFEKWAGQLLNAPVKIDNVRVSWYQYQPEIRLNRVAIFDAQAKHTLVEIRNVSIFLSIPASIWQRKLVPSGIMIAGSDLSVLKTASGEYAVQGFPAIGGFNDQPFASQSRVTDLLGYLALQPRIILRDIDVRYNDVRGQKHFISIYDLSLANSGRQHHILGKGLLHQDVPTEINFALEWIGAAQDLTNIKAKAYVYVTGVALNQWLQGYQWHDWEIQNGVASAKIWLEWEHAALQKWQTAFQVYNLQLMALQTKTSYPLKRLSGNVGWKRQGESQVYAGDDILLDLPTHLWPVTSFYVLLAPNAAGQLTPRTIDVNYIDIADLQHFLLTLMPNVLPEKMQSILGTMHPQGNLQNITANLGPTWDDWQHTLCSTDFNQLTLAPWERYPGMTNLSGKFRWTGSEGDMQVQSKRAIFQYERVFPSGLALEQFNAKLQVKLANGVWTLVIPDLAILNADAAANLHGTIMLPVNGSPVVALNANIAVQDASKLKRYFPLPILDPDLANWMQQAFIGGEIKSVQVELQGAIADFPFDKKNGHFTATAQLNNFDLQYAPDWPPLKQMAAKLLFTGRKINIDVAHAELGGIPATNIHGVIPYLGDAQPQILQVTTDPLHGDFNQFVQFVQHSPLDKNLGGLFTGAQATGPVDLHLALTVPFKNPDDTQVQGSLDLHTASLNFVPWHLNLERLAGTVNFTENSALANNVSAQLFNKPLQFNLATIQKNKQSIMQASFATNVVVKDIEQWLTIPATDYMQGATDVKGKISFSTHIPTQVNLQSALTGIAINLPAPYGKKAPQIKPTKIDITLQEKQPIKVQLSYADQLSTALILERKDEQYRLQGATLRFGHGQAGWPTTSGIYITGEFTQLNGDQIYAYLNQAGKSSNLTGLLRSVDVQAGMVNIAGQILNQVRFQLTPEDKNYFIKINSNEVIGQIEWPINFTRQANIQAQFQKLNLQSVASATATSSHMDVKSLPSINLQIASLKYNDLPLGQVLLQAVPAPNGLVIQLLRVSSPRMDLRAAGDWEQDQINDITHLRGTVMTKKLSELLNSFGFDVRNFVASTGKLIFDLNWLSAPYAPTLSSMSGSANLILGAGRIVDIGENNGTKMGLAQLLNIFSLQTIPRRLTFDFSDVFQKGYSFDKLSGDFKLQDGDAYTNNFRFDGTVATVGINGRIGLKERDFSFTMVVTPYVTSSIPLAATLIYVNPYVALGALAVNTVLGSQFSKAMTYYYDVTGPWNNPAWKSVKVYKHK